MDFDGYIHIILQVIDRPKIVDESCGYDMQLLATRAEMLHNVHTKAVAHMHTSVSYTHLTLPTSGRV